MINASNSLIWQINFGDNLGFVIICCYFYKTKQKNKRSSDTVFSFVYFNCNNRYVIVKESAANYVAQKGAPKSKINIGMPFYGHAWTVSDSSAGVHAPGSAGKRGPYLKVRGTLSYYEVLTNS